MVPGLEDYLEKIPPSTMVDGGYYSKVPDNMPVIGPATAEPSSRYARVYCFRVQKMRLCACVVCAWWVAVHAVLACSVRT